MIIHSGSLQTSDKNSVYVGASVEIVQNADKTYTTTIRINYSEITAYRGLTFSATRPQLTYSHRKAYNLLHARLGNE